MRIGRKREEIEISADLLHSSEALQDREEPEERPKKRFPLKRVLLSGAALAAAIIAISGAVIALRGRETMDIMDTVYTVINGEKITLSGGIRLVHKDGKTTVRHVGTKYDLEDAVLVDEDINGYIFESDLSINRTDSLELRRTDHFSKLVKDAGGIKLTYRNKENTELTGFLYDNKDTYIFLEPAELNIEDRKIEIGPMTAVEVSYQQYVQIYGPGIEPEFIEYTGASAEAFFAAGKKINLSTDRYYQKNGEWRLLFLPLESLKDWA